jgi:hypothetical protein
MQCFMEHCKPHYMRKEQYFIHQRICSQLYKIISVLLMVVSGKECLKQSMDRNLNEKIKKPFLYMK